MYIYVYVCMYMQVTAVQTLSLRDKFDELQIGAIVPKLASCSSSMYRRKHKEMPTQPKTLADLNLSGITLLESGEVSFAGFRRRRENCGILYTQFSSKVNFGMYLKKKISQTLHVLKLQPDVIKTVYMDGTFWAVPRIFTQLYTIHALYNNQMIAFIYALLPNKTMDTYVRLFRLIQSECARLGLGG